MKLSRVSRLAAYIAKRGAAVSTCQVAQQYERDVGEGCIVQKVKSTTREQGTFRRHTFRVRALQSARCTLDSPNK